MKKAFEKAVVWCVAVFLTLAAAIAFYFILNNGSAIMKVVNSIFSALTPVWIGLILAYLVDPIIAAGEKRLKKHNLNALASRAIMIVVVLLGLLFILYLLISQIVPKIVGSINNLVIDLPGMQSTFSSYLEEINDWNESIYQLIIDTLNSFTEWLNTNLFATVNTITQSVFNLVSAVIDLFLGIIVFFYAQFEKERFAGQSKKLLFAVCHNRKTTAWILRNVRQANLIFSGFISGKIIDSAIVGVICFICLNILKLPYPLLISIVIGVTNIIPVFGPFIGAIPCALVLLFIKPVDCLIFAIFILILQQVDGNIIGPRILGDSTGISAFWVIFAILVFGNLFGFIGMVVGVPIFATIYYIVKNAAENALCKEGLPKDSTEYIRLDHITDEDELIFFSEESEKKSIRKQRKKKDENKKGENKK